VYHHLLVISLGAGQPHEVAELVLQSWEGLHVRQEPDPVVVARGIESLARALVTDGATLTESLETVARAATRVIPGLDDASVILVNKPRPSTWGAAGDVGRELAALQLDGHKGPSLVAATQGRVVHLRSPFEIMPWNEFSDACRRTRIRSILALPLFDHGHAAGVLTLYSHHDGGFGQEEEFAARAFAGQASSFVVNAAAYWTAREHTRNLQLALESRSEIEQAKGILMALHHCTADEAFDMLRTTSQAQNRKLRDIAREIVGRPSKL